MDRKPEPIHVNLSTEQIERDLQRYQEKAVAMGATKAKAIQARDIPVDERVTLKCQVPRCFGYGTGANCPPNTLKPAELRDILAKCSHAVLFIKEVPARVIVRDKTTIKERVAAYQEVYKIVSELESMAFYDGHYLAFGFGAGSCRHTFCGLEEECLAQKGGKCRFSLRSRPSMEAVGIDVYRMVADAGWSIHPIGSGAQAGDIPCGVLAGLVVVR
jgi:predicted metal-binding protein